MTRREAQKANSAQLRGLRANTPGVWEKLKRNLTRRRCEGCSRSLYGFQADATTCSHTCRSKTYRARHGAGSEERRQNQLAALDVKRWRMIPLIKSQIQSGTAYRTWGELALIDPAYKALKPKYHVVPRLDEPVHGHPDNMAFVAAWRARDATPASPEPHPTSRRVVPRGRTPRPATRSTRRTST
jgi:hypothetical protein